jgi:hypothetical protein
MKQSLGLQSSLGLACGGVNLCMVGTMVLALNYNEKYSI